MNENKTNTRKTSPWVALYPDDFLGSIAEMDNAALGLYFRLLLRQASTGSVPDPTVDERAFCRAGGCFPGEWTELWEQIGHKFEKCEDGRLRNPRMERELATRNGIRDKRIEAGRKGGRPPAEKANEKQKVKQTESKRLSKTKANGKASTSTSTSTISTHTPTRARARPTQEEVEQFALGERLDSDAALACFFHYDATATPAGWINGSGNSLQWQATVKRWVHDDKRRQIAEQTKPPASKRGTTPRAEFDASRNKL